MWWDRNDTYMEEWQDVGFPNPIFIKRPSHHGE